MEISSDTIAMLSIKCFMAGQRNAGKDPSFAEAKKYALDLFEELAKPSDKVSAGEAAKECYECVYKRSVPGNTHIECANPDPEMTGDPHGIKEGWFMYPILFDPTWKTKKCYTFKKK